MFSLPRNSASPLSSMSSGEDSEAGGSASQTKDDLIDQMQEKFGQLLKENQRLCEFKAQNEALRNKIENLENQIFTNQQNHELQVSSLEKQNQILAEKNYSLMDRISSLEAENIELKAQNNYLKTQRNEEREQSSNDMQSQKIRRAKSYAANMAVKDQQINELKNIIQNLTEESSNSSSQASKQKSFNQQLKDENEAVKNENKKQQKQLHILSDEVMKLRGVVDQKSAEIADFKQKNFELAAELDQFKNKTKQMEESNSVLMQEVDATKKNLSKLTNALPPSHSIDDYAVAIKTMIEQNTQFQADLSSATSRLKKAANAIRKNQESITGLSHDVECERLKNVHLQKIVDDHESKNEKLITQVKGLSQTRAASSALAKAFHSLCKDINNLEETIEGQNHSFRPLITVALIIRRWQLVIGTQQFFVTDQRNWWWLVSSMHHHNPYDVILAKESIAAEERNLLKKENEELKGLIASTGEAISKAEHLISDISNENEKLKGKNMEFEKMRGQLSEQMMGMKYIDIIKLKDELNDANNKITALDEIINNNEKEKDQLLQEINKTSIQVLNESALRRKMQKECELLRSEISCLLEKIQILEEGKMTKDRDLFVLERSVREQKGLISNAVQQGSVVVRQNQILSRKLANQKKQMKTHTEENDNGKNTENVIKSN